MLHASCTGKSRMVRSPRSCVQVPDQLIGHMHLSLHQGGCLSPPGSPDCSMLLLLCSVDAAHAAPPSAAPAVLPLCAIVLPPVGSVLFQPHVGGGGPIFLPCNAQLDYYQ